MLTIIITLIIISWVVTTAYIDAEHLVDNEYIESHTSRTIQRILFGIVVGIVNPVYGVLTALLFWALFDSLLNSIRSYLGDKYIPWNYIGSTANTDKFMNNKPILYWGSKVISLILALLIIF